MQWRGSLIASNQSEDLWKFNTPNDRSMELAMSFIFSLCTGQGQMALETRCNVLGRVASAPSQPVVCRNQTGQEGLFARMEKV